MTDMQRGQVMFVDDEAEILGALELLFEDDTDVAVTTHSTGQSALDWLADNRADVIVADLVMPEMSGLELLAEARRLRPKAKRMILTGFGEVPEVVEALERGDIARLLSKPWDAVELRGIIEEALDRRGESEDDELAFLQEETGVTEEQLARARRVAGHLQRRKPLVDVLIDLGYLSREEHEKLKRLQRSRMTLSEILRLDGMLDEKAFATFERIQQSEPNLSDREILIGRGLVTEEEFLKALASKHYLLLVEPEAGLVDNRLLAKTSIPYLHRHGVLPLHMVEDRLHVVMANPLDRQLIHELERIFGVPVAPLCATTEKIRNAVRSLENERSGPQAARLQYREIRQDDGEGETGEEAVRIVDYLLLRAIQLGASDLHIEPQDKKVRVRVRVDGVLRAITDLPGDFAARVVSRLKILAGADIAERRLHQDGRILVKVEGRDVDIRFSTYASMFGENAVLRILDRKHGLIPLDKLGFPPPVLPAVRDVALKTSTGLVLVTGPTGSGKTTTLYSFVSFLSTPALKVITCEDPVEYLLEGVVQCSVNEKTGPTFADSLRAILRQDPDIVLVGEIRDRTTANLAVEAALTGHKVLSTLHTEDAVGTVLRLVDMDLEPFMVASTVCGLIAQRLVRRVCPHCRQSAKPSRSDLRFLSLEPSDFAGIDLLQGAGCKRCEGTGYKGRMAIHEVLMPDDDLRDAILSRAPSKKLRSLARTSPTFLTLQEVGIIAAIRGHTTLAEVTGGAPRDPTARKPVQLKELSAGWRAR